MPEPTRDPIQSLESFGTGGLSVTPLDPTQVRRLGDQRRTRRTATIGVAASVIAVVGLVVPVTLVVAGDDEPPRPPATQTPSPTPTPIPSAPPLGLGDIPEDFPLDVDTPDLSGDGGEKRGPGPAVETAGLTLCGRDAIREATTKGRLGFSTTGPEFVENRELRTFASEGAATTVMNALQEDLNGCTSWTEPDADHTVTPIVADTGQDSITFSDTVQPLGGSVYQITRVGSAILTIMQGGEYSVETAQVAGTEALAKITRKITPEMCLFTDAGCGQATPSNTTSHTITYPGSGADTGIAISAPVDLARLRNAPEDFKAFVGSLLGADPHTDTCGGNSTKVTIRVTRIDTAGYAVGAVGGCPGHSAIWARRTGQWQEVLGGTEVWTCSDLEREQIPLSFVGACYDTDLDQTVVGGDFGPTGVDGVALGMSLAEVQAIGGDVRDVQYSCEELFLPGVAPSTGASQGVYMADAGAMVIWALPAHRTPEGISLGSSRADVVRAYPSGRFREPYDFGSGILDVRLASGRMYTFEFGTDPKEGVLTMQLSLEFKTCDSP